jgi:hypothetical protein
MVIGSKIGKYNILFDTSRRFGLKMIKTKISRTKVSSRGNSTPSTKEGTRIRNKNAGNANTVFIKDILV